MRIVRFTMVLALLFLAGGASAGAETKRIDKRTHSSVDHNVYYLVFCAREAGQSSVTGHAFVAWAIDSDENQVSVEEAWGFYPQKGIGVFRAVPGEIRNEAFSGKAGLVSDRLIVLVDRTVFERAREVFPRWRTSDYRLAGQNCISFMAEVAGLAGLRIPSQKRTSLPAAFVRQLITLN